MSRSQTHKPVSGAVSGDVNAAARAHDLVAGTDIVLSTDVVVIGLGTAGLTSVRSAASSGLSVAGLDVSGAVVDGLNSGTSHVTGVSDDDVARLLSAGFRATRDESVLDLARTVIICVPTPLAAHGSPDLSAVLSAGRAIARHLQPGMLVILASTSYPGTTDDVLAPILEESGLRAGVDFSLACAPERSEAGHPSFGMHNTPKVVGGYSPACTDRAAKFYGRFVDTVVQARGTREAEMAKLLEDAYLSVNTALVNEMAQVSRELGVDVWDAIRCAATKPFAFASFKPGPGVTGPRVPAHPDHPSYRGRKIGYPFRVVELAHEVNDGMPRYVARRVQDFLNRDRRAIKGADVLLLGVTSAANIGDRGDSPAVDVARSLIDLGALVTYADPYVPTWSVDGRPIPRVSVLREAIREAHVTVLLQPHSEYETSLLRQARLLFDTRGIVPGAERL